MNSTDSVPMNIDRAEHWIVEAVRRGAQIVLLPEYWGFMGSNDEARADHAEEPGRGPMQEFLARTAQRHHIWLFGGSVPLSAGPAGRFPAGRYSNSLLVYDPGGRAVARYDKIHLFQFSRNDESYDESVCTVPGKDPVFVDLPIGRVGLSICYDLRFPELYRSFGNCSLIVMPAAFTRTTGRAHWELLIRTRAVENQCYVLASAQTGSHPDGRQTWGHSMLAGPWGEVVSLLGEDEGIVTGEFDLSVIQKVRNALPALENRRL